MLSGAVDDFVAVQALVDDEMPNVCAGFSGRPPGPKTKWVGPPANATKIFQSCSIMNRRRVSEFVGYFRNSGRRALLRVGFQDCQYCHRDDICISRPKTLGEEIAVLLLLRPVRCHDCSHRFLRPLFVFTPLPNGTVGSRRPAQQAATREKVERRSA